MKVKYDVIKKLRTWAEGDSGELEGLGHVEVVHTDVFYPRPWYYSMSTTFRLGKLYYRYEYDDPSDDKEDVDIIQVFPRTEVIKKTTYLTKEERDEAINSRLEGDD